MSNGSSNDPDNTERNLGIVTGLILVIALVLALASHTSILGKVATFGGPTPAYGETSNKSNRVNRPEHTTTVPIDQSRVVCVNLNANPYAGTARQPAGC